MDFSADTTFNAALPYAGGTLVVAAGGAILAVAATATAIQVAAIAASVMGAYAFFGVVGCGIKNAGNPDQFREEVVQAMVISAGAAIADIAVTVAKTVLIELVQDFLYGNRRRAY